MNRRNVAGTLVFDGQNPATLEKEAKDAGHLLRQGALVAFPTETVYGLGSNAMDVQAVKRVFTAKGRPDDNPLIVHISDLQQLQTLAKNIPDEAWQLCRHFWPGPLTLVLEKHVHVPDVTTGGLDSVAVRMPAHPAALALIKAASLPVAAPSANLSGRPSPTTAEHVLKDLAGRIEAVLDGGPCEVGVESTVLDIRGKQPRILRPGGVTPQQISAVLNKECGVLHWQEHSGEIPPSPGLKYLHYAPHAPLYLLRGGRENIICNLQKMQKQWERQGKKAGLLVSEESASCVKSAYKVILGSRDDPAGMAARLYSSLRYFDECQVDVIIAEGYPTEGIGLALMNRLQKAAGPRVIDVE